MDEASPIACRSQVWILLSTGDSHVPDLAPSLVEVAVHGVDAGVVRCHGVVHVHCDVMRLQQRPAASHNLHRKQQ